MPQKKRKARRPAPRPAEEEEAVDPEYVVVTKEDM
jgi:hypothetical protein